MSQEGFKVGERVPAVGIHKSGWPPENVKLPDLCAGKKVVLVNGQVCGAYDWAVGEFKWNVDRLRILCRNPDITSVQLDRLAAEAAAEYRARCF